MKKIAYIIPYFGKLPEMFPLWLKSCENNPTVDFHLYSDCQMPRDLPRNVIVHHIQFSKLVTHIQHMFPEIQVGIRSPYRLCDFRPAYGYIFQSMLGKGGYDCWGFCDIDILFGDIRHFFSEAILERYKKIGFRGHSTVFRNENSINQLFRSNKVEGVSYQDIFSDKSDKSYFFDEIGINKIFEAENISIYKETIFADISPLTWNFRLGFQDEFGRKKNDHRIFEISDDRLLSLSVVDGEIYTDEFMYVHFLRRRMLIKSPLGKRFLIIPNTFIPLNFVPDVEFILRNSRNRMLKYWLVFVKEKWRKITFRRVYIYLYERIHADHDAT